MIELTTPDFVFRVKNDDIDLRNANHIYLTLKQGCQTLEKTENDLEILSRNEIGLWMDQEEISQFKSDGKVVEVQLNWTYNDLGEIRTKRAATTIKNFRVGRNLLKRVVE